MTSPVSTPPGAALAATVPPAGGLAGIRGHAWLDLEPWVDLAALDGLHDELCRGLCRVPLSSTGGSHRSMGIMPASRRDEAFGDYGEVLARLPLEERRELVALADDPDALDPEDLDLGEERAVNLNRRQIAWLKIRHGVYFPWQAYYEMIPNHYWDEKSSAAGKDFTREARALFPRTVAFVRALPFASIGRCNVMGLDPFHHGTVHRDGHPAAKPEVDHFITFRPGGAPKVLFLWDEAARRSLRVTPRVYWFNDSDYHGVEAAPEFRYSIRVDGVFTPDFLAELWRAYPVRSPRAEDP